MGGWVVVVTTPKYIEELAKATNKELSQPHAMMEVRNFNSRLELRYNCTIGQLLSTEYTLGDIHREEYHVLVMKNELTRGLSALAPLIHEEMVNSFAKAIPLKGNG